MHKMQKHKVDKVLWHHQVVGVLLYIEMAHFHVTV